MFEAYYLLIRICIFTWSSGCIFPGWFVCFLEQHDVRVGRIVIYVRIKFNLFTASKRVADGVVFVYPGT